MTWTTSKVEQLTDLMEYNLSINEIADILKVTRGAIAGKMSRIREQAEQQIIVRPVLLPPRHWAPAILAAVIAFSSFAEAQPFCGPRTTVLENLIKKYKEYPIAVGVTFSGELLEIFTSHPEGTWTILRSNADGTSCFVDAGEAWRALKPINKDPKA